MAKQAAAPKRIWREMIPTSYRSSSRTNLKKRNFDNIGIINFTTLSKIKPHHPPSPHSFPSPISYRAAWQLSVASSDDGPRQATVMPKQCWYSIPSTKAKLDWMEWNFYPTYVLWESQYSGTVLYLWMTHQRNETKRRNRRMKRTPQSLTHQYSRHCCFCCSFYYYLIRTTNNQPRSFI